jgi:hypothetical protein
VLHNIHIRASRGLTIGNAEVSGDGLAIQTTEGEAITKLAGTSFTIR